MHFPPPFIYVAGMAAGWFLHRVWPLPMTTTTSSAARDVFAAVCLTLWLALMLGAFVAFRRVRTTVLPNRPAAALATSGPYRLTRNPMYVSLAMLYAAVTLALNSWWPAALLPVVLLVVDRFVIAREERYLSEAFPEEYAAYRRRVRRWL